MRFNWLVQYGWLFVLRLDSLLFSILTETLLKQASVADLLLALVHNSWVAHSVVDKKWATHVRQSKRLLDPGYSEYSKSVKISFLQEAKFELLWSEINCIFYGVGWLVVFDSVCKIQELCPFWWYFCLVVLAFIIFWYYLSPKENKILSIIITLSGIVAHFAG